MCLSQVLVSYKYFHDTRKDNMLSFFLPPTYKNTKKKSNGEKENPYHHPHPHKNIPMNLYIEKGGGGVIIFRLFICLRIGTFVNVTPCI